MEIVKRMLACVLTVCLVLFLTACGGGSKDVDLDALAADLTASSAFTEDMSQYALASSMAANTYRYAPEDVESCLLYANLASGEEIFLAKTAGKEEAAAVAELCKQRIEGQKASLENYAPDAIPRLDNAILETADAYVIFVVANDAAAAQTVVNTYLK